MNRLKLVIYIGAPLLIIFIIIFLIAANSHSIPDNEIIVSEEESEEEVNLYIIEPDSEPGFPEKHIDVLIYTCLGTRQTEQLLYIQ